MGADFKQLTEFTKKIEKLNDQQKEEFLYQKAQDKR